MAVNGVGNYYNNYAYPQTAPQGYNPQTQAGAIPFGNAGAEQQEEKSGGSNALLWVLGIGAVGTAVYFLSKGKFGKNLINKLKGGSVVKQTTVLEEAQKLIKGNKLTGEARKEYAASLKELFKDFGKKVKGESLTGKTPKEVKDFVKKMQKEIAQLQKDGVIQKRSKVIEELAEDGKVIIDKTKAIDYDKQIEKLQKRMAKLKSNKGKANVQKQIDALKAMKAKATDFYKATGGKLAENKGYSEKAKYVAPKYNSKTKKYTVGKNTPKFSFQSTEALARQKANAGLTEKIDNLQKLLDKAKKNGAADKTIEAINDRLLRAKGELATITEAAAKA